MTVILKIDKGTAERLLEWIEIKPWLSRNLTGKELTLEIHDEELVIALHRKEGKRFLEVSDVNGSFGLWFELTREKFEKLQRIIENFNKF
jgi:hypothetical protein